MVCLKAALMLLLIPFIDGRPQATPMSDKAKRYLVEFGYLDSFSDGDNEEALAGSLVNFQYFANLPLTGKLDDASLQQMTIPRCGHADPKVKVPEKELTKLGLKVKVSPSTRLRRYVHQGTKWVSKSLLTWKLIGRGRTLDRETIRTVMIRAFEKWRDVTNLDFKETGTDNPDIWIKFATYYHDDPYAFDGQGGTLAHAFYPHNEQGLSGDIHFDDSEDFTHESAQGRNLLWVATHEIGHSIGMEHSNIQDAVMYPWYQSYKPSFSLTFDDISGIQALYGSRVPVKTTLSPKTTATTVSKATTTRAPTTQPVQPTTTPRPTPRSVPCPSDIAVVYYNSYREIEVLITSDDKIAFLLNGKELDYGPYERKNYIPYFRIPGAITAGFSSTDIDRNSSRREYTVLFSGSKYYLYQSFSFRGGPYSIYGDSENPLGLKFPNTVKRIDAAFEWPRNNRIYFFSGDSYWRYDAMRRVLEPGYPRPVRDAWVGVPTPIDAIVSSKKHDYTYFIKGNMLYSLDNHLVKVKPGYPQHVGQEWLNCGGKTSANIGHIAGGISDTVRFNLKGTEP